jgi:hypothetical protein
MGVERVGKVIKDQRLRQVVAERPTDRLKLMRYVERRSFGGSMRRSAKSRLRSASLSLTGHPRSQAVQHHDKLTDAPLIVCSSLTLPVLPQ